MDALSNATRSEISASKPKKIGALVQDIIDLGVERITDRVDAIASFPGGLPAYTGAGTRGGFVSRFAHGAFEIRRWLLRSTTTPWRTRRWSRRIWPACSTQGELLFQPQYTLEFQHLSIHDSLRPYLLIHPFVKGTT